MRNRRRSYRGDSPGIDRQGSSRCRIASATISSISSAIGTSMAVAAAWLLLAASGRWRSEPGWLDGLGRVLGTFWIAIIPFSRWWDYHVLY
jgi:hypothetical protein